VSFLKTPRKTRDLPKAIQTRVARGLTHMASDPFRGNVRVLQGEEWKGVFRMRIGLPDPLCADRKKKRSGKTYR